MGIPREDDRRRRRGGSVDLVLLTSSYKYTAMIEIILTYIKASEANTSKTNTDASKRKMLTTKK